MKRLPHLPAGRQVRNAFTLVELLIVIALIAILSVAVLATINPIEQSNKAKDSTVQNDAAEVLNAYERYYASQSSYPWVDVIPVNGANHQTVDSVVYLNSSQVGGGLCGMNGSPTFVFDSCNVDYSTYQGLLLKTTELKDSFLAKGYAGNKVTLPTFENMLYTVKLGPANGNSIYVCYIPKAKANRSINSKLVALALDANNRPTQYVPVDTDLGTYFSGNDLLPAWDFTTAGTSLFKCVP